MIERRYEAEGVLCKVLSSQQFHFNSHQIMLTTAYPHLCKVHTQLYYILASFPNQIEGPGNKARDNLKITVERCRVSCYGILCAAEFNWRDALNLESQLTEEEIRIR